ncbi:MAG: Diacylglycerol kinase [Pseudomonadota bacterium]|jgi:diacylglycerol kinase family enzyme
MTLVLLNPHAQGGQALRRVPAMQAWLSQHAPQARLAAPETLRDSLSLLQSLPLDSRVVVAGGDGTINRWLPALLARRLTMGLVPMGSGNDSARALGMHGQPWRVALQHALQAHAERVDTGLVTWTDRDGTTHENVFLSSLTTGFDSAIALRALNGPRWLRGLPRYVWATIQELAQLQTWSLSVHADGQPLASGPALFASSLNTPTFGAGLPAVPHARINDGQLDALLAGPFQRLGVGLMLPRLMMGWHLSHPRVQTRPYRRLDITCPSGVPLAADGEYLGEAMTLRVSCQAAHLPVVMGRNLPHH